MEELLEAVSEVVSEVIPDQWIRCGYKSGPYTQDIANLKEEDMISLQSGKQ